MELRGVSGLALAVGLAGLLAMPRPASADQCGKAAWYDLHGLTASGEPSNGSALAAAHRSLPFGTKVRVQNLANGREVVVRVNDRGPFTGGRIIDVTRAAAEKLGMINAGVARVRVSLVDGGGELGGSCSEKAPRVLTADATASEKPAPKTVPVTTAKAEPDPVPRDRQEFGRAGIGAGDRCPCRFGQAGRPQAGQGSRRDGPL